MPTTDEDCYSFVLDAGGTSLSFISLLIFTIGGSCAGGRGKCYFPLVIIAGACIGGLALYGSTPAVQPRFRPASCDYERNRLLFQAAGFIYAVYLGFELRADAVRAHRAREQYVVSLAGDPDIQSKLDAFDAQAFPIEGAANLAATGDGPRAERIRSLTLRYIGYLALIIPAALGYGDKGTKRRGIPRRASRGSDSSMDFSRQRSRTEQCDAAEVERSTNI